MEDVAVVDLIGAFALEFTLELHSYLGGVGMEKRGKEVR
jgi:hypothetical protein